MKSKEKRIDKLKQVLKRLSRGEIVQNRQLKIVLGAEEYARYFSDCEYQKHLRAMLKDKPDEIIEYEQRLKAATFAYSKADSKGSREISTRYRSFAIVTATVTGTKKITLIKQASQYFSPSEAFL